MRKRWKIGIATMAAASIFPLYWLLTICKHDYTRPFTFRKKDGTRETYVVCINCGKEFEFDLATMQIGKRRERP